MQTTMAADGPCITAISTLDWPAENDLEHGLIQCAGRSYLAYESRLLNRREFLHSSSFYQASNNNNGASSSGNDGDEDGGSGEKKKKEYDLLSLSERKLKKLNYYQVLGANLPMHASTEDIRKAYHKACLKYHPDKTGRGEEDEVFLLVKAAFDTLSDPTKRRSYDSTVDFDESIPKEGVEEADFYAVYGPVFERNLRFASFNDPMRQAANTANNDTSSNSGGGGGKKKGGKKNKNRKSASSNNLASQQMEKCPPFGDDDTPLDQVHAFYEFWIHFESWRDFTLKATKETEHDVEAADSRDEKRWMKQEIDRKVKKMKKEEMARINLLVERAMAADPRLRREKERVQKEKAAAAEAKRKEEEAKAEKERLEREKREAEEAKKRMEEESKKKDAKKQREMEKKQLRKAKQLFRKLTMTAYQAAITSDGSSGNDAVWDDLEKMNDDIELLCDKLSAMELVSLSDALGGANAVEEDGNGICVEALVEVKQCAVETAAGAERQSLLAIKQRNQARKEAAEKQREQKAAKASSPWSKEELAALAKAVKKYPPGGSNRWDAIALFVNNLCKLAEPRTKEECIEKYNQVASSAAPPTDSTNSVADDKDAEDGTTSEAWTEEQDAQLQEMLRKYPADMDKNERWKAIANGIDGKSKKECVQRFKAIREAVRQGKK